MKKSLMLIVCILSLPLIASTKNYQNEEGCKLNVTDSNGKVIYTLSKGEQEEVVTFSSDYMEVDFAYCPNKSGDIFFTEGSKGYGLMVFCDENLNVSQRGVIDLEVRNDGNVNSFSVISEVKVIDGTWEKNKSLSCRGFKPVND